ncbi:MAG: carbonic anhydrase [Planctomycetota bacterium]
MPRTAALVLLLTAVLRGQGHGTEPGSSGPSPVPTKHADAAEGSPAERSARPTEESRLRTNGKHGAHPVLHRAEPEWPAAAALEHVREGNARSVEAKKASAAPPEPMPRPGGAGRFLVAVISCADAAVDVAALLSLKPEDVLLIQNAGAVADADAAELVLWAAREHRVSLCVVLTHSGCPSLNDAPSDRRAEPASPRAAERGAKSRELARRRNLALSHAHALLQKEQLDAAVGTRSPNDADKPARPPVRIVPATVDVRTGEITWHLSRAEQMPIAPVR